ncbi:MAG TPA: MaoC/PaaZ C-terminal domain-containing protein [Acidimicrobiales bacterium]|nr:MaoC/PaaZ C-terminal domain-containing protein [Acidimicrobiales bacterium]
MSEPSWDELQQGDEAPSKTVDPVTLTDIVRYQGASGDLNPLHHDDDYARAAGFERAFSAGMFQAGVVVALAASWLGPERVRRVRTRFRTMLWPGDTLTCSVTVTGKRVVDGERLVDVALVARGGHEVVVEGDAVFSFGRDEAG